MKDVTFEPLHYGKAGNTNDLLQGLTKKRQKVINANRAFRQRQKVEHAIDPIEGFNWNNPVFQKPRQVLTIGQRFHNIITGGIAHVRKIKPARMGTVAFKAWASGYAEGRKPQVQKDLQP